MVIVRRLKEKLIPTDKKGMDLLYSQMASDMEFEKLLTTPFKYLPRYKFLVEEAMGDRLGDGTLLDLIKNTAADQKRGYVPYFCVSGNKIIAFFAYKPVGGIIENFKMFSLQDSPNGVLAKDVIVFIKQARLKYRLIQWKALKANPANDQYLKALRMFTNANNKPTRDNDDNLIYTIPGLEK